MNRTDCGLHKFRKAFAILQHRAGLCARTLQKRLGHSALETTPAYLEAEDVRSERTKQQVNAAFGVFAYIGQLTLLGEPKTEPARVLL